MTEPDRIWINDKWEAYLRPTFDGDTSGYVRADLARPTPLAEALAAAQAYIEDLEAHEGAEGFSTSTAKLGAAYYAALRAIGEGK